MATHIAAPPLEEGGFVTSGTDARYELQYLMGGIWVPLGSWPVHTSQGELRDSLTWHRERHTETAWRIAVVEVTTTTTVRTVRL